MATETNHTRAAGELWLLDLDRTLLDSSKAFEQFVALCTQSGYIDNDALITARHNTEASGGSFNVIGYLKDSGISNDELALLYNDFAATPNPDLLYDDTLPFLESLREHGKRALILTYGGVAWQGAKLEACGLSAYPHMITPHKHKGELLQSWKNADTALYTVPLAVGRVAAKHVTLVDDKASSFTGIPEDCDGYYIIRDPKNILPSQRGELPKNIMTASCLNDIPITQAIY